MSTLREYQRFSDGPLNGDVNLCCSEILEAIGKPSGEVQKLQKQPALEMYYREIQTGLSDGSASSR